MIAHQSAATADGRQVVIERRIFGLSGATAHQVYIEARRVWCRVALTS
jgi:hypothetical protein